MELAITAMNTSSGASSGSSTSSMWIDFRGSLSGEATPSNISCSSARTTAARNAAGSGSPARSSPDPPSRTAVRIASISVLVCVLMTATVVRGGRRLRGRRATRLQPGGHRFATIRSTKVLLHADSRGRRRRAGEVFAMPGSVIVSSARTPIGKLSGAFASLTAMDLGGVAIKAALERGGVGTEQVDYVLMGQVLQAGQGQITARQAAAKAGIPMSVPAMTVNKVCLSGINAIYLADQMIQSGDAEVVVAGGMESMTQAPYVLPGARAGYRMGNSELVDSLIHDGLWC